MEQIDLKHYTNNVLQKLAWKIGDKLQSNDAVFIVQATISFLLLTQKQSSKDCLPIDLAAFSQRSLKDLGEWKADSLIEVEASRWGRDADVALLHSHNVQVHEVAVHLPVSRRRVPAAHGQDLQALHGLSMESQKRMFGFWLMRQTQVMSSQETERSIGRLKPSSLYSVAGGAPGGAPCCQAGCVLEGCSRSAPARCPSSFVFHCLKTQGETSRC